MTTESQARTAATRSLPQLNTLTKYPSILTLHALGDRGRLTPDFTTPGLFSQPLTATEKIDGTSARLLVFADGSYVVGSRENLLTVSGDLLFDPAVGIVEGLRRLVFPHYADEKGHLPRLVFGIDNGEPAPLTVLFGEFYGGKVTGNSKQYGPPEQVGFRVFDVAVFTDAPALATQLQADIRDLSTWRESETPTGLRYGQPFLPEIELAAYLAHVGLPAVPHLPAYTAPDSTHESVLAWLREHISHTQAALPGQATPGRAEGAILRTADRSAIVKIRFEDYERTLNQRSKG
ncbi:RNA ligase family protein [Hymenobacter gummosus]|uniref:RNA ligase family protein n=1 Tax=Hymenobacter gummosus TaxID=1776032 RepID=UPI001A9E064B|nr:RNA ligase family protein [Hymenobacter gummosus]